MIHRIPGACFGHDECVFSRAVSIATVHFFFSPWHHRASASAPPRRRRQRQRRCNTIRYTLRQVTTADEFFPQTNSTPTDCFSFLFFFPFRFLPTNFPRRIFPDERCSLEHLVHSLSRIGSRCGQVHRWMISRYRALDRSVTPRVKQQPRRVVAVRALLPRDIRQPLCATGGVFAAVPAMRSRSCFLRRVREHGGRQPAVADSPARTGST